MSLCSLFSASLIAIFHRGIIRHDRRSYPNIKLQSSPPIDTIIEKQPNNSNNTQFDIIYIIDGNTVSE